MPPIRTGRTARSASAPGGQPDPAARRRWLAPAVLALAQFMIFIEISATPARRKK
jgi:hypothetical protein